LTVLLEFHYFGTLSISCISALFIAVYRLCTVHRRLFICIVDNPLVADTLFYSCDDVELLVIESRQNMAVYAL